MTVERTTIRRDGRDVPATVAYVAADWSPADKGSHDMVVVRLDGGELVIGFPQPQEGPGSAESTMPSPSS